MDQVNSREYSYSPFASMRNLTKRGYLVGSVTGKRLLPDLQRRHERNPHVQDIAVIVKVEHFNELAL